MYKFLELFNPGKTYCENPPQWVLNRFFISIIGLYLILFIGVLILFRIEANAIAKTENAHLIKINKQDSVVVKQQITIDKQQIFLDNQGKIVNKQQIAIKNIIAFQDTQRTRRIAADARVEEWKKAFLEYQLRELKSNEKVANK